MGRRAVPHVLSVAVQKQDGAEQSIGLPFHQKDKTRQNL
jgi:hypothetical protein